jgi:hypothetical protein
VIEASVTDRALGHQQASDLGQDAGMADRWRAAGGWCVEIVRLEGTPDHHDGTWLRVTQHCVWTADVGSVAELEQFFPLGELEPDGPPLALAGRRRSAALSVGPLR